MLRLSKVVLILILSSAFHFVAEAKDELKVTYIANEGFLLESGGRKVLIDALFGKEDLDFCDVPPRALLKEMLAAEPPFDDVNLVIVSHDHVDHFDEAMVIEYMIKNPHCELIGTAQAVERLKKSENHESLKARIHGVTPPAGTKKTMTVNKIEVSVLPLKHCTYYETDKTTGEKVDRHRNEQNIGVIIKLGDQKILHIGDSAMDDVEEYKAFDLIKEKIDVAMLGSIFWKPFAQRVELVNKAIQPKSIIPMHLEKGDKDKYSAYKEAIQESLPPITFFKKPKEKRTFPIPEIQRSSPSSQGQSAP